MSPPTNSQTANASDPPVVTAAITPPVGTWERYERLVASGKEETKAIDEATDKYVYYLMGIAAATIAYAMHRTIGVQLVPSHMLLLIAIVFLALSFSAGHRNRKSHIDLTSRKFMIDALQVTADLEFASKDPTGRLAHERQVLNQFISEEQSDIKRQRAEATRSYETQFNLLTCGATFLVFWHIVDLGEHTPDLAPFFKDRRVVTWGVVAIVMVIVTMQFIEVLPLVMSARKHLNRLKSKPPT
jgi:hypothetical protein